MKNRATAIVRFVAARLLALPLALSACGAAPEPEPEHSPAPLGQTQQALQGHGGGVRMGYTCADGLCTCDKGIENDCEDMSGVCVDADIDDLIRCIDGWLTTGCTCHELRAVRGLPPRAGLDATRVTRSAD